MPPTTASVPAGTAIDPLPSPMDTGSLGVYQLKRAWARNRARQEGRPVAFDQREFHLDHLTFDALGVGLEQTMKFLAAGPSFDEFERWIIATTGGVAPTQVARINAAICGLPCPPETARRLAEIDASEPVLSADDLRFWDEQGYVVLHDAVSPDACAAAADAVLDHLGVHLDDPGSWYGKRQGITQGIMVQYFQHPAFDANRRSRRIHKAFAQLWDKADLWVTTDRVGFNPPERESHPFPGPDLHWDVSVQQPIPLSTHGILLSDRHRSRARRIHGRPGISSPHRRLAREPARGRRSAPPGSSCARLAADRRTRRRPRDLAWRHAARQPAQPRPPAAHRPIHCHVSDGPEIFGRLDLGLTRAARLRRPPPRLARPSERSAG